MMRFVIRGGISMFSFLKKQDNKIVNVNDLDNLIGKIELIDIREPNEYKNRTLETAKNIPMGNLLQNPDKYFSKDKTYYIMCQSGIRSSRASKQLSKQGFDVINVTGGVGSYSGNKRKS